MISRISYYIFIIYNSSECSLLFRVSAFVEARIWIKRRIGIKWRDWDTLTASDKTSDRIWITSIVLTLNKRIDDNFMKRDKL